MPSHFVILRTCSETKHLQISIEQSRLYDLKLNVNFRCENDENRSNSSANSDYYIESKYPPNVASDIKKIVIEPIKQYKQIMLLK